MLVKNNSKRNYVHSKLDEQYRLILLTLRPQEIKEIPDNVAKSWIKSGDVEEYVDPQIAKKEQKKIEQENKALKKELQKLKTQSKKSSTTKQRKKPAKKVSK